MLHKRMSKTLRLRAFKSAWFAKAAKKARISDAVLCKAIAQVMAGQADDLGGGVYKKRLSNNQYRSIILARGGDFWVYEFLFAKQDKSSLEDYELGEFRSLTKIYQALTKADLDNALVNGKLVEICAGLLE